MNKSTEITILQHGVNDEFATVIEWLFDDKSYVEKNQPIALLETTKATFELEASCNGYLRITGEVNNQYEVGHVIGYITEKENTQIPKILKDSSNSKSVKVETQFTKKALKIAKKYDLDLNLIKSDHIISEKEILEYVNIPKKSHKDRSHLPYTEKIFIYGAPFSHAVLIDLEIIKHFPEYQVAYYVDDDPSIQGKVVYGIDVLSWKEFEKKQKKENINKFFISIGNMVYRREKFRICIESGMEPINLIHPSAEISSYAEIKSNVLIKRGAIIGPGTLIGDGCIIDNGVTVSHDCSIDSFCHLAPGVSLGSDVTIKTFSVISVGASISTGVTIGESVIVATGSAILQNVENQIVMSGNPANITGKSNIPRP